MAAAGGREGAAAGAGDSTAFDPVTAAGAVAVPATAAPSTALLIAVGVDVSDPVAPVGPEPPDDEAGELNACEVAAPVSPLLVELEPADAAPLLPAVATGLTATLELPPAPPPLDDVPEVDPPVLDVCAVAGAATSNTPPATTAASRKAIAEAFRTATFVAQTGPLGGGRAGER